VAQDGAAAWRKLWVKRRAANGVPAQRLDLDAWLHRMAA
jgi:hypothetical protein